jgi:hypothetical protein
MLFGCLGVVQAQELPLRYAGEIGHMRPGERKSLGTSLVARLEGKEGDPVRIDGQDRHGKPWRLDYSPTGGVGFTTVWTADFNADGQPDVLIESLFPGLGACVDAATVTLLLFDENGRPNPWPMETMLPHRTRSEEFPFKPVYAVDVNRNGRAEFILTDCSREKGYSISGVYEAGTAGDLAVVQNANLTAYRRIAGGLPIRSVSDWAEPRARLMNAPPVTLTGLDSEGIGCDVNCRNPVENETLLGDGRRIQGWPDTVVVDLPEGRDIYMDGGWDGLQRVLREGYSVRIDGSWVWATTESGKGTSRADIQVEFAVTSTQPVRAHVERKPGGCLKVRYEHGETNHVTDLETCSANDQRISFQRTDGGTVEQLLPDRRTVHAEHTAMQHTVTSDTRYEQPLEGRQLIGIAECCDFMVLTQWTAKSPGSEPVFALHDRGGGLLVSRVMAPPKLGLLITNGEALAFLRPETGVVVEVRGRLRWRRKG